MGKGICLPRADRANILRPVGSFRIWNGCFSAMPREPMGRFGGFLLIEERRRFVKQKTHVVSQIIRVWSRAEVMGASPAENMASDSARDSAALPGLSERGWL